MPGKTRKKKKRDFSDLLKLAKTMRASKNRATKSAHFRGKKVTGEKELRKQYLKIKRLEKLQKKRQKQPKGKKEAV